MSVVDMWSKDYQLRVRRTANLDKSLKKVREFKIHNTQILLDDWLNKEDKNARKLRLSSKKRDEENEKEIEKMIL